MLLNCFMKSVEEIRRENLLLLAKDAGGLQQLAVKLGKSYSQLSQWKNRSKDSKTGKPRTIVKETARAIEIKCGKPELWLDADHSEPSGERRVSIFNTEPGPDIRGEYPLISWIQAGEWMDIMDNFNPGDAEGFYACPKKCSPQTFMLRVRGPSMEPKYQNGDLIYVDPSVQYQHGSNVVVKLVNDQEATFKNLVIEGNKKWLKPLNSSWPEQVIQLGDDARIVGVVIGKFTPD